MRQVRMLPRHADLTDVQTGVYVLKKEPNGLDAQRLTGARIIGVDPGMHFFFAWHYNQYGNS